MSPVPSWDVFAGQVSDLAGVPIEVARSDARVIEDLDLDSLALAELAVLLADTYGLTDLGRDIDDRSWEETTLESLFEEISHRSTE
jgi:acyl carrier protein